MKVRSGNRRPLVTIPVTLAGPRGRVVREFLLDTGATFTLVAPDDLQLIGATAVDRKAAIATVSGMESCEVYRVESCVALGREKRDMLVLSHRLPAASPVSRVLGLDFLRPGTLCIDFDGRTVELTDA